MLRLLTLQYNIVGGRLANSRGERQVADQAFQDFGEVKWSQAGINLVLDLLVMLILLNDSRLATPKAVDGLLLLSMFD